MFAPNYEQVLKIRALRLLNINTDLRVAKAAHYLAAPLGDFQYICIDDIKYALPASADLIETSINS